MIGGGHDPTQLMCDVPQPLPFVVGEGDGAVDSEDQFLRLLHQLVHLGDSAGAGQLVGLDPDRHQLGEVLRSRGRHRACGRWSGSVLRAWHSALCVAGGGVRPPKLPVRSPIDFRGSERVVVLLTLRGRRVVRGSVWWPRGGGGAAGASRTDLMRYTEGASQVRGQGASTSRGLWGGGGGESGEPALALREKRVLHAHRCGTCVLLMYRSQGTDAVRASSTAGSFARSPASRSHVFHTTAGRRHEMSAAGVSGRAIGFRFLDEQRSERRRGAPNRSPAAPSRTGGDAHPSSRATELR